MVPKLTRSWFSSIDHHSHAKCDPIIIIFNFIGKYFLDIAIGCMNRLKEEASFVIDIGIVRVFEYWEQMVDSNSSRGFLKWCSL